MDAGRLVKMANDIGHFFAAGAETDAARAQAMAGIADHLKRFWDPRMRRALLAALDAGDATGLEPLVVASVHAHRALLTPPPT